MKKLSIFTAIVGAFSCGAVLAGPTAVQEGIVFTANGATLDVAAVSGSLPIGCAASHDIALGLAYDVVLDNGYAIVTSSVTEGEGETAVTSNAITAFDVSGCFAPAEEPACTGEATVDLQNGILVIPCLKLGEDYFNVHMDRRGNSFNWEVTFVEDAADDSSDSKGSGRGRGKDK